MGQHGSTEDDSKMKAVVKKLDKVKLRDIEALFMELSTKDENEVAVIKQPTWLNRHKFAEVLGTSEFMVEQLFEAFDRDKNGVIDMKEFVTGMAICLNGSINKKCGLLFKIFNLDGDDGIDPKELALVLTNCLQSAHTLLRSMSRSEGIYDDDEEGDDQGGDQLEDALITSAVVDKIVKDAFEKCDVTHTGKLNVNEFANWVHKNPKLVNNIFVMRCPKSNQNAGTYNPSFSIDEEEEMDNDNLKFEASEHFEAANTDEASDKVDNSIEADSDPVLEKATILQMASSMKQKDAPVKPTLKDLFSQPNKQEGDNFFDSIGNEQQNQNNESSEQCSIAENSNITNSPVLQRTQSEFFSKKDFMITSNIYSGSQDNLNQLPTDHSHESSQEFKNQSHAESLYSIALSQESLIEGKGSFLRLDAAVDRNKEVRIDLPADLTVSNIEESNILQDSQDPLQHAQTKVNKSPSEVIECPLAVKEPIPDEIGVDCLELMENISKVGLEDAALNYSTSVLQDDAHLQSGCIFWQPKPQTIQLLQVASQGNILSEEYSTRPTVISEGTLTDPVTELVEKYLGEQEASKRLKPYIDTVDLNEQELCKLLENGYWRAALDFTTKFLLAHNQLATAATKEEGILFITPKIIQIWFVRITLLVHLRMFSIAEAELNAFKDFDAPDLYYQFYENLYPNLEGSMVPFSFRLLHSELPQHNGRSSLTLNRLYNLLDKVDIVLRNLSKGFTEGGMENEELAEKDIKDRMKIWEKRKIRIHYSIVNCFLGMKDYRLAVKLLEQIITLDPSCETAILSAIGRVYLQLGDCKTAQNYFQRIKQEANNNPKSLCMVTMNKGYLSLAKGLYDDSYQQFLSAFELDQNNLAACNNAAVCLLFMGKVKEASDILETMVCRSPEESLHEEILLNLTTVYELETSRALQKKHKLLDLVCKHKGDGFNVQCLKLT